MSKALQSCIMRGERGASEDLLLYPPKIERHYCCKCAHLGHFLVTSNFECTKKNRLKFLVIIAPPKKLKNALKHLYNENVPKMSKNTDFG